MTEEIQNMSPAEKAAVDCELQVLASIDANKNFRVEAGAGAGKTYTLIKAIKYLIDKRGSDYLRSGKRIACITYTNVAKDEIKSRTDNHPAVLAETIHAFSWELIKDFQNNLREQIPQLSDKWVARITEAGGIVKQVVKYDLGYPKITDKDIYLHHDDVIKIMTKLLDDEKFKFILFNKFPVIFIDEYQDTNIELAQALVRNFIMPSSGPLIGLFGDHWQKIYGTSSCGLIDAPSDKLNVIGKQANFRSDTTIVESLNKIRPELIQHFYNPESIGEKIVYHSNNWNAGNRRTEAHWKDDLPEQTAHDYLEKTLTELRNKGWVINSETTKILMLTNNVLAAEQGYQKVFETFGNNEDFLKKNDAYIEFLGEIVEPGLEAFEIGKYGEMIASFGINSPKIRKHSDKEIFYSEMTHLNQLRKTEKIGNVIDYLKETKKPRLSTRVSDREVERDRIIAIDADKREDNEIAFLDKLEKIRSIPYPEIVNLVKYIDDKTLFSTKHGVKGAEFENVIIVFGRGWNQYNWNQFLEWYKNGYPEDKRESFERNRNLFYVACSRPRKRLALLFTQKISESALELLNSWFDGNIVPLDL